MVSPVWIFSAAATLVVNSLRVLADVLTFFGLCLRLPAAVAAENLFLRKQLGLYIEGKRKPRRPTDSVRFTLAQLSRLFCWQNALTIVQPDTLIRWHRKGFRLF
jgi:putative transposase